MNPGKASGSFAEAWSVLYQARTLFTILLIISMGANIAVFLAVRFAGVVDPLVGVPIGVVPEKAVGTPSETMPAGKTIDVESLQRANWWASGFRAAMTFTSMLAIVSVIFMAFCALVGVMVLISAGLPGAGAAVSGFFWALAAGVLLLPWIRLIDLPIGLSQFEELLSAYRTSNLAGEQPIIFWVQHLAFPVILILFSIMYLGRTSQAHAQMSAGTASVEG